MTRGSSLSIPRRGRADASTVGCGRFTRREKLGQGERPQGGARGEGPWGPGRATRKTGGFRLGRVTPESFSEGQVDPQASSGRPTVSGSLWNRGSLGPGSWGALKAGPRSCEGFYDWKRHGALA